MASSLLFKVGWTLQITIGICLFVVCWWFEFLVITDFFSNAVVALFLTAALEGAKALAIAWHRYLSLRGGSYPGQTRYVSAVFRVCLLLFSLLCSMVFLASALDRPNLAIVRADQLAQIKSDFESKSSQLLAAHAREKKLQRDRQSEALIESTDLYDGNIGRLELLLIAEMDNKVNNHFIGPRYREFSQRLQHEKLQRQQIFAEMSRTHQRNSSAMLARHRVETEELQRNYQQQYAHFSTHDFSDDERANNQRISAIISVTKQATGFSISPLQFVMIFSVLLSVTVELGIVLAFETIIVAMLPAIATQHEQHVRKASLEAEISGEHERDHIDHEAKMNRAKNTADRLVERARKSFSQEQHSAGAV